MSKVFVISPLATKSNSLVSSAQPPQQGFQLEPNFGELDAPSFGLNLDNIIEPQPPLLDSDDDSLEASKEDKIIIDPNAPDAAPEENVLANSKVNTRGEKVQDVSDSTTTTLLEPDGNTSDPAPESFISFSWPYLMVGLAFVGWVVVKMFSKSAPSFKHHKIEPRDPVQLAEDGKKVTGHFKPSQRFQKTNGEAETTAGESSLVVSDLPEPKETNTVNAEQPGATDKKLTGQFKIAKRFQKPKTETATDGSSLTGSQLPEPKEVNTVNAEQPSATDKKLTGQFKIAERFQKPKTETATDGSSLTGSQLPEPKEANAMNSGRPADDEFDVELGDGFSDSDVLDSQEAAEIIARVDARQAEGLRGPSARFKAEIGEKAVSPKDRV